MYHICEGAIKESFESKLKGSFIGSMQTSNEA